MPNNKKILAQKIEIDSDTNLSTNLLTPIINNDKLKKTNDLQVVTKLNYYDPEYYTTSDMNHIDLYDSDFDTNGMDSDSDTDND